MSTVKVQGATPAQIESLTDLWYELIAEHEGHTPLFGVQDDSRKKVSDMLLKRLAQNDTEILVAQSRGVLAGMVIVSIADFPEWHTLNKRGYIAETVVLKSHRSEGLGHNLVEAALHWIKEQGGDVAELQVSSRNPAGVKFWEREGFDTTTHHLYKML